MRIFTLVQWTFGFLATSARTKDEIRLNFYAYLKAGSHNVICSVRLLANPLMHECFEGIKVK